MEAWPEAQRRGLGMANSSALASPPRSQYHRVAYDSYWRPTVAAAAAAVVVVAEGGATVPVVVVAVMVVVVVAAAAAPLLGVEDGSALAPIHWCLLRH